MYYCLYNLYFKYEYYCDRIAYNFNKLIEDILNNLVNSDIELPSDEEEWDLV